MILQDLKHVTVFFAEFEDDFLASQESFKDGKCNWLFLTSSLARFGQFITALFIELISKAMV